MADVSKLRIHERLNIKRLNLLVLVTRIGNENWENWFIWKGKYENWQHCEQIEIANRRIISKLPVLGAKLWFSKVSQNFLNFKHSQLGKFQKLSIWKIRKISNLNSSKNFQFGRLQKFSIHKIPIISQILQFRKSSNFPNFTISKNSKFSKFYNLENLKFHEFPILWIIEYFYCSNNLKKYKNKNKFEITKNEKLIFRSFNIRIFEISKYRSF